MLPNIITGFVQFLQLSLRGIHLLLQLFSLLVIFDPSVNGFGIPWASLQSGSLKEFEHFFQQPDNDENGSDHKRYVD